MKLQRIEKVSNYRKVADAARTTISRDAGTGEPNKLWKKVILLSEHSPIRLLKFHWKWTDLPYWVSVHFTRHKFGIDHWVSTQRNDRQDNYDRKKAQQDSPVMHEVEANAQAIINISRKRLCKQASEETQKAWKAVLEEIKKEDEVLYEACVPECVYRGFCPEFYTCGYTKTLSYELHLEHYRKDVIEFQEKQNKNK